MWNASMAIAMGKICEEFVWIQGLYIQNLLHLTCNFIFIKSSRRIWQGSRVFLQILSVAMNLSLIDAARTA